MKKNSYNHLSKKERYEIKEMIDKGMGITEIAENLDRSKGAISMEVNRNKENGKYMPCVAHEKYEERLHKEDELKIEKSPFLQSYIAKGMKIYEWAPDVIAGRLKLDKSAEIISTESIYRYVYTSPIAIKEGLYRYLPQKKLKRQERGKRVKRVIIPNRTSIHERPAIANHKKELGHVEVDLTFHKGNQSKNIGVMVDKATQKVFLILNRAKTSLTVTTGFMKKISLIPEKLRKTLTMDNGKEFVGHMAYKLMSFNTYFCDAYRPRQKALVEKMNSMIHRILPKNIDINTITQEVLDNVENILNNMPRRIFGYKTPNEMWEEKLQVSFNLVLELSKTFLYTGVRVSELIKIKLSDVDLDSCQIRIVRGKGKKDRIVPFPKLFMEVLAVHIDRLKQKKATYLFESARKKAYSDRGVRKIMQKYTEEAGIEHTISPHKLRHFLFTWMKRKGVDDALIQPYSGHQQRSSLEVYSKLSLADCQEEYENQIKNFPI